MFTRVYSIVMSVGVLCLLVSTAGAEPVSHTGTWRGTSSLDFATNVSTARIVDSGSNNAFGQYMCTVQSSSGVGYTSEKCGPDAVTFLITNHRAECTAEGLNYPFTIQYEDVEQCAPLSCYNADPPPHFSSYCPLNYALTGTVMGGDGETHGVMGRITSTQTGAVTWERQEDDRFVFGASGTSQGTLDVEFIEAEEEQPARGFNLEIPAAGATVTSVGIISGWSCLGGELQARITDAAGDVETVVLSHGSPRTDTEELCGDSNNGFSATQNWNRLAAGAATIELIRNGAVLESNTFSVLKLSEDEFLEGASGMCVVQDFPGMGQGTVIEWDESRQGFFPTEVRSVQ